MLAHHLPLLLGIIFVLGYLMITLEHKIGVNKAATALVLAVVCWNLNFYQAFPHDEVVMEHMNSHLADIAQVVVFLLGAMTIVELIDIHQGFRFIHQIVRTDSKRTFLWIMAFLTFFVSSVLDNLTTSIVMVTLLRRFITDKNERMIFAGMIIIAANAGGAWTPIGDVTTTMLWIGHRISSAAIIHGLFFPSLVSVLVPLIYFSSLLKSGAPMAAHAAAQPSPVVYGSKRVLTLGVTALIMVPVLHAFTGLPPYLGILFGLGMMWVITDLINQERHFLRVPQVLAKIDISSVLFFLGILLSVAALETAGVLDTVATWTDGHIGNKDVIIALYGLVSSVIDNVPLTAAIMGMYPLSQYPLDSRLMEMTAFCAGTGGSILIIGSAAGVVVMGMEKIKFTWYLKHISLIALAGYVCGILTLLWTL